MKLKVEVEVEVAINQEKRGDYYLGIQAVQELCSLQRTLGEAARKCVPGPGFSLKRAGGLPRVWAVQYTQLFWSFWCGVVPCVL
jgi:hypothetical protein